MVSARAVAEHFGVFESTARPTREATPGIDVFEDAKPGDRCFLAGVGQ